MTKRRKTRLTSTAAILCALILSGTAANVASAATCGSRDAMLTRLNNKFKEHPRAIGMVSTKGVVEILVSKTGSWTILMTMANGKSCMVAAGQNWEQLAIPAEHMGPAA